MLVVFPAPLGPIKPNTSPGKTLKLTRFTATVLPNVRTRFSNSIAGREPEFESAQGGKFNLPLPDHDVDVSFNLCILDWQIKTVAAFGHRKVAAVSICSFE